MRGFGQVIVLYDIELASYDLIHEIRGQIYFVKNLEYSAVLWSHGKNASSGAEMVIILTQG